MKRYAFIDAQNTASTTQKMCGSVIDWAKLCAVLKDKKRWNCDCIYLYSGIEMGDTMTTEEFAALDHNHGCVVRTKTIMAYKNPDKTVAYKCPNCGADCVKVIDMGYRKKSNCDVELTLDVMGHIDKDTDLMIFTADGDFECLMRKAISKGATVKIVSHPKRYLDKAGLVRTRFSRRLRELVADHPKSVVIIDIARWKELIKKDIGTVWRKLKTPGLRVAFPNDLAILHAPKWIVNELSWISVDSFFAIHTREVADSPKGPNAVKVSKVV